MIDALTIAYVACFQACAIPALARVVRRGSSHDLSVWREWLLLAGVAVQFVVMTLTGASWYVKVSPIASGLSVAVLLGAIYWFRKIPNNSGP